MPVFVEGTGGPPDHEPTLAAEAPSRPGAAEGRLPPFRHLARHAADALDVARVGLWHLDGDGALVCLTRFHRESLRQEDDRRYPPELGRAFRFLLERAATVAMNDTRTSRGASGPVQDWLRDERIRALLALPVRVGGRLAGWITWEEEGEPRRWSDADRDRALPFAAQLGGVLACWSPAAAPGASSGPSSSEAPSENGAPARSTSPPRPRPTRGGRREVRGRLRPLPALEGAALLGGESVGELLHLLEVQGGYLSLLDEVVRAKPDDRELVAEAREVGERVREGLVGFLRHLREGIPGRELLDLTAFLGEISGALSRLAGERVRLRLAPAAETLRVRANPRLLERALGHLVQNARDASPMGATVRISWGRVARERDRKGGVPGASGPGVARIVVEDEGRGIAARDLPWVFEPFYSGGDGAGPDAAGESDGGPGGAERGTRTAFARDGSRGMGLPVVQAVIEGHGGWVDLDSRPGQGTRVALHLPLVPIETEEAAPTEVDADEARIAPPHVLVIEDEPLLARLLERTLVRSGFRVTVVEAPEDALEVWGRMAGRVDLVIVERTLTGGRDGVDLVAPWRGDDPELRILVLDRRAASPENEDDRERSWRDLPLLTRPFQPADVVGRVRELLARPDADGGGAAPHGARGAPPGGGPGAGSGGVVLH